MEGCPRVCALEYHPDGNLKRIELLTINDMHSSVPFDYFDPSSIRSMMTRQQADAAMDGPLLAAKVYKIGDKIINGHGAAQ